MYYNKKVKGILKSYTVYYIIQKCTLELDTLVEIRIKSITIVHKIINITISEYMNLTYFKTFTDNYSLLPSPSTPTWYHINKKVFMGLLI